MINLLKNGAFLLNGTQIVEEGSQLEAMTGKPADKDAAKKQTIAYGILNAHNVSGDMKNLKIKFDAMASHDITYVGIIQTARASGLKSFPLPYVLTNCHNSLCAVGGTINEDDHVFGLSAAKKYGGVYVPAHFAVIHQYMREMMSGCGKMILGSDSHTRYGALGTLAIGEGGGELAKQLLNKTYDVAYPEVVGVYLTGKPAVGVGPMDVALAIIGAVFKNEFCKNKVMEFVGDGVAGLSMDFRNGIDVMTTETACLSSVWITDGQTEDYYKTHGRAGDYKILSPGGVAYYDGMIVVDLAKIKPMIAMPFHPSNVYTIDELNANLGDILREVEKTGAEQLDNPRITFKLTDKIEGGRLRATQGVIAGCAGGTFDNIVDTATILGGKSIGSDEFSLSVYPSSQPVYISLVENGAVANLMTAGATLRSAFCGPCFGAGDVPANNGFSIRHSTRNFPNREGSKPSDGQIASVALMDARSIAATAANGGFLTAATSLDVDYFKSAYSFKSEVYKNRVYDGVGKPMTNEELKFGPNITDWPKMSALPDYLLLRVAAVINDPVTTTDELIPSGETSSYRSNPVRLSEFTLSRKEPKYVARAKHMHLIEEKRLNGICPVEADGAMQGVFDKINAIEGFEKVDARETGIGSVIYAVKPGDGSAREQAASCQKVLGGWANIARGYATKRYRSNLINWGIIPFLLEETPEFGMDDYIFIPDIRNVIKNKRETVTAYIIGEQARAFNMKIADMTDDERDIIIAGCLINYYA